MEEWMKQEEASADQMTRISEMTTSSSMYTARRLRLLGQAAREPDLMHWSQTIQPARKQFEAPAQPAPVAGAPSKLGLGGPAAPKDSIRVVCSKCQNSMRVPLAVLRGKTSLNIRCPQCQTITTLRQKTATTPAPQPASPSH
jgi:LSD1 subclass zinc finger protein